MRNVNDKQQQESTTSDYHPGSILSRPQLNCHLFNHFEVPACFLPLGVTTQLKPRSFSVGCRKFDLSMVSKHFAAFVSIQTSLGMLCPSRLHLECIRAWEKEVLAVDCSVLRTFSNKIDGYSIQTLVNIVDNCTICKGTTKATSLNCSKCARVSSIPAKVFLHTLTILSQHLPPALRLCAHFTVHC